MKKFLTQPYPFVYTFKKNALITIGATLFVTFFLFFFRPFGLYVFEGINLFTICLQFGLATGAVMAIFYFILIPAFPALFLEENWTVIKHIGWVATILISIAVANTLLMYNHDFSGISLETLFISLWQVTALGIILTTIIVSLDYLRHFKANQKEAKRIFTYSNEKPETIKTISLFSENDNEQLHLKTDELLYLTSADNYIEVVYQSGKKLSQKLLRGTLLRAENMIGHSDVIRCHRSYIVNLQQVVSVEGTAQGYKLYLRGLEKPIPVSRSYKKEVMQLLKAT